MEHSNANSAFHMVAYLGFRCGCRANGGGPNTAAIESGWRMGARVAIFIDTDDRLGVLEGLNRTLVNRSWSPVDRKWTALPYAQVLVLSRSWSGLSGPPGPGAPACGRSGDQDERP